MTPIIDAYRRVHPACGTLPPAGRSLAWQRSSRLHCFVRGVGRISSCRVPIRGERLMATAASRLRRRLEEISARRTARQPARPVPAIARACSARPQRDRAGRSRSSGRCRTSRSRSSLVRPSASSAPTAPARSTTLKLLTRILKPTRGRLPRPRTRRGAHRGRGRISPRPDRPGEHLSAGRDHGHEARGDRRQARRDHRVRRRRARSSTRPSSATRPG